MALTAAQQWWMRPAGLDVNGGGYDATVSGAGTNYSDQDAAQLTLTDLAAANASTTVTSVTGGFTTLMIGNLLAISAGTNALKQHFMITARTDTNTITVDRTPTTGGAMSAASGKVGGAKLTIAAFANGGTMTAPTVTQTAGLAAGHTINVKGAGTADPSTADYASTGAYATFAAGDVTNGRVRWIGYTGRPRIDGDALTFYQISGHAFYNLKFVPQTASFPTFGFIHGTVDTSVVSCILDANGIDSVGVTACTVVACWFKNTGGATAGTNTNAAINGTSYNPVVHGTVIDKWRGDGIYTTSQMITAAFNVIANCKVNGIEIAAASTITSSVLHNTIHGNTGDGIKLGNAAAIFLTTIRNNIITGNGGYGINDSVGSAALNDRTVPYGANDYNNFGTGATANTSGARHFIAAGVNDLALDPQFVNAGAGNYAVGANMKAVGLPGAFLSTLSTGYLDLGAVQRQEPAGGAAGMLVHPGLSGGTRG